MRGYAQHGGSVGSGFLGGSYKIGRVWGIDIKLHMLFLFWIGMNLLDSGANPAHVLLENILLFGSVLLHELGHCAGARFMKGEAKEVILWPLGGLAMLRIPNTAKAEFVSTAAGPMVNLLLCGLAAIPLAFLGQSVNAPAAEGWIVWTLKVNAALFLFNVVPAYPMDGGRILRSILWPLLGWRRATLVATVTAMVFGVAFLGLAVRLGGGATMILALIGVMVLMASWREFQRAKAFRVLPKLDDERMPHERK